MTDLRSPTELPTSTIRITQPDWSEFTYDPAHVHVLEFVTAYQDSPAPATMQALLAFPGPGRNTLLNSVSTLRFFDVIDLDPDWDSDVWVSLRDPAEDRLHQAADRARALASAWPSTRHLKLHWLADRDNGWVCRDCRVGLIDVCRDDDMEYDQDGYRFVRPGCGKELPTVDHAVPQALGGSNLPINLALVCRPCNSAKGAS